MRDQLLVLKRDRFLSIVVTILGGIFMLLGVARVMVGGDLITSWFQVVWGFLMLVFGVVMVVRKRRQLKSFELEHGTNPATQRQLEYDQARAVRLGCGSPPPQHRLWIS